MTEEEIISSHSGSVEAISNRLGLTWTSAPSKARGTNRCAMHCEG